ncbi:MAG: thioredoxin family protein [Vicingaceae bacterium]|nr:thioredoxin family protein [Vicingaceae bacterium]
MITQEHINKSISFEEYYQLHEKQVATGSTSGKDQSEALVEYTKLNFSRLKRSYKTTTPSEKVLETVDCLNDKMTWLVLTETWCGDAAQNIPVLAKIAEANPAISFRLIFRDENPEVMDNFLTNGSKSIPKLIALDKNLNILGTWGPRPTVIQDWFLTKKANGADMDKLKIDLQHKYNEDKGQALQQEMVELMKAWLNKECFSI